MYSTTRSKGKIERFFRTVRDQFLVEIDDGVELTELGRLFSAWLEVVYHRRVHSECPERALRQAQHEEADAAPGHPRLPRVRLRLLPNHNPHHQQADLHYRCIGSDNYRQIGGRVCHSRPIRADQLDGLVWDEVRRLLEDPALVRAEIDRRLQVLRTEHPASRRREALERDITRAESAITRLIEAYQEQLLSIDELRARMPALRKRQTTLRAQLDALDTELHDAETYLKLADTLDRFLGRLADGLDQLNLDEQQRILRLVVHEILIDGDDDTITIRHSIPTPTGPDDPSYLLRGSRPLAGPGESVHALRVRYVDGPELSGLPV